MVGQGVLIAVTSPERGAGAEELQAVELLANQAGQALSTAHLYLRQGNELDRHAADARRDGLTRLGNRRTVDAAIAELRPGDAVFMLDLDRFKEVNDIHGHATGDDTLRQLATYLPEFARPGDMVGRHGGEEFTLVLPRSGAEADGATARLLDGWRALEPITSLSVDYAVHAWGCAPQGTLRAADQALYRAKHAGRDQAVRGRRDHGLAGQDAS